MFESMTSAVLEEGTEYFGFSGVECGPDASPALGTAMFVFFADRSGSAIAELENAMCWSGLCVASAGTADEAITFLDRWPGEVSIALVDADRSSAEAARVLAHLGRRHPDVLPVAVVGWETRTQARRAYADGAEIVMQSPFSLDELTSALLAMRNQAEERARRVRTVSGPRLASLARQVRVAMAAWRTGMGYPRTRSCLRTLAILLLAGVLSGPVISVAETAAAVLDRSTHRVAAFMDNVEGYLQRDEERERTVWVVPSVDKGRSSPSPGGR
ncbi:MAG: hypothetical protein HYY93_03500 [Planctomycetes bacterium]|nr:hypothetical protein [Planctomycetota bacterium]